MPLTASSHPLRPLAVVAAATLALVAGLSAAIAGPAHASTSQISIMEPGTALNENPAGTLSQLRQLGVAAIRLNMSWINIAPSPTGHKAPHGFKPSNPSSYPAGNWVLYDTIIEDAKADGIAVDLDLAGKAPQWAMPGYPSLKFQASQYPSPSDYQSFVEAVGKRYSGTFKPKGASKALPRVNFWGIWNEPNYISSLRPQGTGHNFSIDTSARIYRTLVAAAWTGLHATGHGKDKILFGELAARNGPTQQNGLFPIIFVRALYCVDSHYHRLRGTAASQIGCPTSAARFRSQNPALLNATGVSVHPYSRWYPPNREEYTTCKSGLCSSLGDIGDLTNALNKAVRAYGSSKHFPLYSTEYGYMTDPPKPHYSKKDKAYYVSTATAAEYLNWAEYISYKNPQIASYDQYLLDDPVKPTPANDYGNYSSGLQTWNGLEKPTYGAFRVPLYLPKTTASSSSNALEVWGGARPVPFALRDTGGSPAQTVDVQFEANGSGTFTTVQQVTVNNRMGYIDAHVAFPGSGMVRLAYTYPASDMLLAPGSTVYSRTVSITVR